VRFVSNTAEDPDFLDEFIAGDVSATSTPGADEHDHDHDHDHSHADHKHSEVTNGNARKRN